QSWPTRVDVHQDVSDGLGGPAMSHPGGPQSPARSAESLHKGPRPKTALLDLSQRQDNHVQQPPRQNQDRGVRSAVKAHYNPLRLGSLVPLGPGKPRSPSLFSVEEDEEEGEEDKCSSSSALPAQVVLRCKAAASSSSSAANRLTSRMSAPVLNQIHEEDSEEEEDEEEERKELRGLGLPKPSLSLNLNPRIPSPSPIMPSPNTVTVTTSVTVVTPGSETSDEDAESHRKRQRDRDTATNGGRGSGREGMARGKVRERRGTGQGSPSNCTSPGAGAGSGQGRGAAKAASGLVESLKLMSLCLSSQFHNLTGGGGGGSVGANDPQERPMWRMCMGGSTGSLDKVSLLGGPSPRGNLHHQPPVGDPLGDPLLEGPCSGTLRLGELDLARENHRNLKNRVLQMPLSDKTLSVNIHRSPKENLLCTPTPHSCCQVI
ncbi:uncharacterized protein ACJ7VT_022256, partial [Polymixia lowei]